MIVLDDRQVNDIMEALDRTSRPNAHTNVWCRRSYAPMHIHTSSFTNVRDAIERALPEYAIAFDVVFESLGGVVDWHCDYESLGPFVVTNRLKAVRESHFLSVHFNLTEGGGHLTTLPWVWLSYVHYLTIAYFGIFTYAHRLTVALSWPLFALCAREHENVPRVGNIFDNCRLHMVSSGEKRTSYVIRLVRRSCVGISTESVRDGMTRSAACAAFQPLLSRVSSEVKDAASIPWERLVLDE